MLGKNGKDHKPETIEAKFKPDLLENMFEHSENHVPKPKNAFLLYLAQQDMKEDKEKNNE